MLNLDTHVLVHALQGTVTTRERALLSKQSWGVSAIVLWELEKLVQLKRITLDLDGPDLQNILASIQIWPLDLEVARLSTRLDFNGDPADELIAATSLAHGIPLLTRDRHILRSKMVPFAR